MKYDKLNTIKIFCTQRIVPAICLLLFPFYLSAQSALTIDGYYHTINANGSSTATGSAQDFIIPTNATTDQLEFVMEGGDGGVYDRNSSCQADGGDGARVTMAFKIGAGSNELRPGGTIRFVVGKKGNSLLLSSGGAGGGGGTAVLYLNPNVSSPPGTPSTSLSDQNTHWILLGVAGGGGGAQGHKESTSCFKDAGSSASITTSGTSGGGNNDGGTDGNGGKTGDNTNDGGAGGGYLTAGGWNSTNFGNGAKGGISGGNGGSGSGSQSGGYGYGGGGAGKDGRNGGGGGGGGYSGGGGGNDGSGFANDGGGGGSFVNGGSLSAFRLIESLGNTGNPKHGYVNYVFRSSQGPVANCKNTTVTLDANNSYTLTPSEVDDNSTVDFGQKLNYFERTITFPGGGTQKIPSSTLTFDCDDIGNYNGTLVIENEAGSKDRCNFTVTIKDNIAPTVVCKDVFGGIAGEVSQDQNFVLTVDDLHESSSDACGVIVKKYLSQEVFTCADVGNVNQVTLTVEDNGGNTASCSVNIGLFSATPSLSCPSNVTVDARGDLCAALGIDFELDPSIQDASCSGAEVLQAFSSSVTPESGQNPDPAWDRGPFLPGNNTEFPVGVTTLRYELQDNGNLISQCSMTITVEDNTAPFLSCPLNKTVDLAPEECQALINNKLAPSRAVDNCGTPSMSWYGTNTATNADMGSGEGIIPSLSLDPGTYEYGYKLADQAGNETECSFSITVNGGEGFEAICQDVTIDLDENGQASITPQQVDNGSYDACGSVILALDQTDFDCSHLGENEVTLTVSNGDGQTANCNATVKVRDKIPSKITCPQDVTTDTDPGICTATITELAPTITDNCSVLFHNYIVRDEQGQAFLSAAGTPKQLTLESGSYELMYLAYDAGGNEISCSTSITVRDQEVPTALCQSQTVALDESGQASLTAAQIDNGSFDNCRLMSRSLDQTDFDCSHLGDNEVTLTVSDKSGQTASCTTTVTIVSNSPTALCKSQTTLVDLDESGQGTIAPDLIDAGSSHVCGPVTLSLDQTDFDCSHLGENEVTLTVSNADGQTASCTATVKVRDKIPSKITCPQDITTDTDPAICTATITELAPTITDNCSVLFHNYIVRDEQGQAFLSAAGTPKQLTLEPGSYELIYLAYDVGGNEISCSTSITVQDQEALTALCQDQTIYLDENGQASLTAAQIDNGSSDNCRPVSLSLDKTDFNCRNLGNNEVTLSVKSASGEEATCTATVTVLDDLPPTISCAEDYTVNVDPGSCTATLSDAGPLSYSDNCRLNWFVTEVFSKVKGQFKLVYSHKTVYGLDTRFNLSGGENIIRFRVKNSRGSQLSASCETRVTVLDPEAPTAICKSEAVIVHLDENGQASITPEQIDNGSFDNCVKVDLSLDRTDFDCEDVNKEIPVTLTVSDPSGNTAACTATVSIKDEISPGVSCQNQVVYLDEQGMASFNPNLLYVGSTDNCRLTPQNEYETVTFNCGDIGDHEFEFRQKDASGNENACTGIVMVRDNIAPEVDCRDITVQLDKNGEAFIPTSAILFSKSDNCELESISTNILNYDCSDAGKTYLIKYEISDKSGNTVTCQADVSIVDEVKPIAKCKDAALQLDKRGMASLQIANINDGSYDACGIKDLSLNKTNFSCSDKESTVILTVTDNNGNQSNCEAKVSLIDQTPPLPDLATLPVVTGECSATVTQIPTATDNCGGIITGTTNDPLTYSEQGTYTINWVYDDGNGNVSSQWQKVIVRDQTPPTALCKNITIQLGEDGQAKLLPSMIDDGSFDECSAVSMLVGLSSPDLSEVSQPLPEVIIYCSMLGELEVYLLVEDNNGNQNKCQVQVTVESNGNCNGSGGSSSDPWPPFPGTFPDWTNWLQSKPPTLQNHHTVELKAFPNPFTNQLNLRISLPKEEHTSIEVFNLQGQRVRTLSSGLMAAGTHQFEWDGTTQDGASLSSGLYLIRVISGEVQTMEKVLLQR